MLPKNSVRQLARDTWRANRWKLRLAGALLACGFGGIALQLASATPPSGVTTTILSGPVPFEEVKVKSDSDINDVKIKLEGFSDVYIVRNVIVPGGSTGWHSHPGISFVTVKSGTATEYHDDGAESTVYTAGSGLVESAGRVHNIRNEGATDLELVAFQIIPLGAVRRIDEPAP